MFCDSAPHGALKHRVHAKYGKRIGCDAAGSASRRLYITAGVALVDDEHLRLAVEQQVIGEPPFGFGFGECPEQRGRAREEH
jgi:hypothetical protein